ncbi:ADP-ribosylglycohydrolase family protein [Nonomuraea jabiensis]|uniref:ADP-ribosylglycohydrolase n=1 Tax=Nonomuraea jabiensis TaxID=882448 RepID=A0A7W9GI40_9ACTN|nr:ADP-ribosylglycohydrolase family protein [Nonomuraea jabiensis]MBB5784224.1 ADP-ribosylglycohydrolase [Nonomuraea jabiensis]
MSGDRIRGAFAGLAVGDAAGWPAARHRAALHAPWSRRLHRELDTFAEEHEVTTLPVPFALNQPTAPLAVGPSDDAEWLAWTVLTIDRPRAEAFRELPREGVRARISVATALDNLAKGVEPPASGHDNPHHFDDAAAVRAVAFGVLGRDPTQDAQVTNAYDGVLGALAMAAAVAEAVRSGSVAGAVEAALAVLPEDTAIGHNARAALAVTRKAGDPFAAVPALDAALLDHVYSYGVGAAQTVPVALALAEAAAGDLVRAVPAAACLAALADSAPALTGALAGACRGLEAIPEGWIASARTLAGCCLPDMAGRDLIELSEGIA